MRVIGLFSGIGGLEMGLRNAGATIVAHAEIDPYASAILAKHHPETPNLGDITKIETYPDADFICAGFPCQDLSNAGKRAGITGERSGLWREVVRAYRLVRPRRGLLENVAALLGRGMGKVLGDLAEIGHDAEWDCIPATAVGLPHKRLRVWIATHAQWDQQPRQEPCRRSVGRMGWEQQSVPTNGAWPAALAEIRGVDDGLPRSVHRTDTLRNAVVPKIAEIVGKAIMKDASP